MKTTSLQLLGAALALAGLASGCKKALDTYYTEVGGQLPTVRSVTGTATFGSGTGTSVKLTTGEVIPIEILFAQQTSPVKQLVILQKIEPGRDSTVVQTIPYAPAFSKRKNGDTLVVNYTVPAGANKANVRVDARVDAQNGQSKYLSLTFRLAEATPTVAINSGPTNVTLGTASTGTAPGDVVRYNLTLNAGGITSAALFTAAGTLYKDLDSLNVYAKVGPAAERRIDRRKLAATGAATTLNVDEPLPAGSAGQSVTFRFEATVRAPARRTSATAATGVAVGAPTAFSATVRTGALAYAGTTGGDLAAYDLTTFAAVAAAGAATAKDLTISSTAGNAVQFKALNATRYVRSTAAVYAAATLTSVRQAYTAAAATAQVASLDNIVVGDVILVKLRGLDQYEALQVTAINRTSTTDVTVNFSVKAL
ncbi:hypothetical protein ACFQ48_11560 [Hymenobacter caeli]|uniref:DUF1735 domain-containing protein n=1 Tax=Hymenobacter caeli TaxID=2735894 RepID=A0ABX2FSR4_9BACT|nr:hypothetical protein [Hymenobacter caeli]NRT20051.1 hypothetical protein [Hymenobacter caeli]